MIPIAIVDDQTLFIKGLRLLIDLFEDVEVLFEATNGLELIQKLQHQQPEVILLDLQMPVMDGATALKTIKKKYPAIKVLFLTMHNDEQLIAHVLKQGANGYLLKNAEPEMVHQAILAVVETTSSDAFLLNGVQPKSPIGIQLNQATPTKLTARELEVLELICKEYTNTQIAKQLYISTRTVEGHRKNILAKTGTKNSAGLVLFAVKNKLITIE